MAEKVFLTAAHREHLLSEGFSDAQIDILIEHYGVRSLTEAEAHEQGFKVWDGERWKSSAGLYFRFADGFGQLRCNEPLQRLKGKPAKYLTPVGFASKAFLPEGCESVHEGIKDAFAGAMHGDIPTGAIAGVSHYRKALPKGCGLTISFDADGWINPQVFASLIHAGKWCGGRVVLLPKIEGYDKAGLVEYFKAGSTAADYRALLDLARKPEDLLQEWPDHWDGLEPYKVVRLARMAACLAVLYLTAEEGNAFIRRIAERYSKAGIRARELAAFAKKWRDRRQKTKNLTTYQREHRLIKNKFGARLAFNELTQQPELDGVPFKAEKVKAVLSIEHGLPLRSGREDLIDSIVSLAQKRSYNPVKDYLEQVWHGWHGKPELLTKLNSLAKEYLGNDDESAQVLLKKTLVAAVARIYSPGCKVDTATVLAGPQGYGKSQFWKTLTSEDWFCDDFCDVDNKDHLLKLHEAWIIEWPELHGLTRKEASRVKSFMTTGRDRIRRPYAREAEWMARPSILVGSSNDSEFLTDSTGNRRWWVVKVLKKVDIAKLAQDRDSIWAAAVALYKSGEPWWLSDVEESEAETTRKQFEVVDAWHDSVADFIEDRTQVSITELFDQVLKIETGRQSNADRARVSNILKRCGWETTANAVMHQGKRQRVWKQKNISLTGLQQSAVSAVPAVPEAQNPDTAGDSSGTASGTAPTRTAVSAVPTAYLSARRHGGTAPTQTAVPESLLDENYVQQELQASSTAGTADTAVQYKAENEMFFLGAQVRKRGKSGWVGVVESNPVNGWVEVRWQGDKTAASIKAANLEAIG